MSLLCDPNAFKLRRPCMRSHTSIDTSFPKAELYPKSQIGFSLKKVSRKVTRKTDEWTTCLIAVRDVQDQAAFVRLFNHFAPRVKGYLIKSGGTPALAEEATQEAMATVWRKAHLFDATKASASTWIFTIARNKQIDSIRKQRRPEPEDIEWNISPEVEALEALEIAEEERGVRKAVAELPKAQRALIEKAYFGDKSHSEIAKETGIPLGTIKSRIRLGLNRIRHELTRNQ